MKAAGYISSYKNHKDDRFIEMNEQREKIENFCQENRHELIRIYEEYPTASPDYKPALMKLISDAAGKNFDKIIVLKFDRFGQDNLTRTWVISELKKYKLEIYSLNESKTLNNNYSNSEIVNKVKQIHYKVRDIPSLPEIVNKVMELVQDPNSSAAQLSKVISHDTGLTSRVLRLVNSAYYGFPKQISSIQHAIMILGFTTIRGLVLSSSIFKIFAQKNEIIKVLDYKKLWKHSLITAISSKKINKLLYSKEEDDIFSAAILHDIGKIILDQYDHDNYVKVLQEVSSSVDYKIFEAERKFCGITHQDIGYMVAEEWNLPENLTDIMRYHHNPLESANFTKLSGIIYLGNLISNLILDFGDIDISLFDEKVLEYLGLNIDDIFKIYAEMLVETENISDLESFFR